MVRNVVVYMFSVKYGCPGVVSPGEGSRGIPFSEAQVLAGEIITSMPSTVIFPGYLVENSYCRVMVNAADSPSLFPADREADN